MSNHRTTAWILVVLVTLQAVPFANAQTTPPQPGSDLIVERIDVGRGVVERSTEVTFYIKNVGADRFVSPARGWQLSLGYADAEGRGGVRNCIEPDVPRGSSDLCYQRFTGPTSTMGAIDAGETRIWTVTWTPIRASHAGLGTLYTVIEDLGCEVQPQPPGCSLTTGGAPSGPDSRPQNNLQEHRIFLKAPGVRAVPLRGAPDLPGTHVNSPWRIQDIKEDCKPAPEVSKVGCKAKPDTIVVFEHLVINEGNSGDRFTARIVDADTSQANLTNRKFEVRYSENPVVIDAPQGTKVVRTEIVIPRFEKSGNATNVGTVTARFEWASFLDPEQTTRAPPDPPCNAQLSQQGVCESPAFPSLLIATAYRLNATTNDSFKQANISELVAFNVTLNNTGNSDDSFVFKLRRETSQINDSWMPSFPPPVPVPAFKESRGTFTMIPPANATKGIHFFEVDIQSQNDTDGSSLQRLRFYPDLQQRFGLSSSMDAQLLRVVPADTATFVMRLTNLGNGIDNVTLTRPENVPVGWSWTLSSERVQVPPFSTVPVYLNVTAPENTPPDTLSAIFVNATSQGPIEKPVEQRPKAAFEARTAIISGSNIRLLAPLTSAFIDPGAAHDFDVTVRNTGNARDNFTISVERDQSQLAWSASVTPGFLVLDPQQQANVRVTLRAPTSGAVGETSKAFLTVKSSSTVGMFKQLPVEGRVSGPDLFVASIVANATSPYSGDPLDVNVVLGNGGNKAPARNVTMKVYFVPQTGVTRTIAERTYAGADLAGGRRLAERILWDTTGIEGAGTLIARIDEAQEVPEIDESPSSNEATRAITIRVFDIRLTPAQGLTGRPGEKVSYTDAPHVFLVEYRGNQPTEPVDIYIESEHGWGSSRLAISLPRGSSVPILTDVTIPAMPGVARDTLRVTVVPSLRPTATVSATTVTTVMDEEKPVIGGVSILPPQSKLGEPVTIRALVTDATGLTSVRAFVASPSNETQSVALQRGPDGAWTHTQTWPGVGVYRVYIEAVDGSEAQNRNTSRDKMTTFLVQPGSAPVISLVEGQSTTVRTGTQVRFNITDPLGVRSATYSLKGVSYDLPRPFALDTSSFTAGVHEVTITAENIYGVSSSARFTITVDNTPPGIRGVTIDPAKPKANQDVTIRIETDAKVTAVDVLIKKDGQVVETLSATRRGSGQFELVYNPGEGDYDIDVTAKDQAGNAKLEAGAVSFSAKPASPFETPGPGLLMALLVLAAVALAARRRR